MVRMPHWPKLTSNTPGEYDLVRVFRFLDLLGNPQDKTPPIVHVAGTNGKGSTVAILRSLLESAGYKIHAYTSPHMVEFNERITLGSQKISDDRLFQLAERCRLLQEETGINLTFFEGTTILAFLAFSEFPADICLIETGMGGRLDPTNTPIDKALTIITPITYDHTEYLGPSLSLIAREKSGIIRDNTPCISSIQTDEAFSVIEEECSAHGAPLIAYEYDFGLKTYNNEFEFLSHKHNINLPYPSLHGQHQLINAATAIAGLQSLKGFDIKKSSLINGLRNINWPGRLEKVNKGKYLDIILAGSEIWTDSAHNAAGANALANWIDSTKNHISQDILIVGLTKGKEPDEFLAPFRGVCKHIFPVLVEAEPSSYPANKIAEKLTLEEFEVTPSESVEDALEKATSQYGDIRAFITGSIYLVGDVLKQSGQLK